LCDHQAPNRPTLKSDQLGRLPLSSYGPLRPRLSFRLRWSVRPNLGACTCLGKTLCPKSFKDSLGGFVSERGLSGVEDILPGSRPTPFLPERLLVSFPGASFSIASMGERNDRLTRELCPACFVRMRRVLFQPPSSLHPGLSPR